MPGVVAFHQAGKLLIVFGQMRARAGDAHISEEHVYELRDLIDAGSPEEMAEWKNPFIACPGLAGTFFFGLFEIIHRSKLDDVECMFGETRTGLSVKNGAWRLSAMKEPDHEHQRRQHEGDDGKRKRDIEETFDRSVDRVFERFVLKREKGVFAFVIDRQRMRIGFFQIVEDSNPAAVLLADIDDFSSLVFREIVLKDNDLSDRFFCENFSEIGEFSEDRNSVYCFGILVICQKSDRLNSEICFF